MEEREKLLALVKRLAQGKSNDAVKLALLGAEALECVDKLELSAVTDFKLTDKGGVELKFLDRVAALQWLVEQTGGGSQGARQLYQALEHSAGGREEGGG